MAKSVKVKASIRKGKVVKAHTRTVKGAVTKTGAGGEITIKGGMRYAKNSTGMKKATADKMAAPDHQEVYKQVKKLEKDSIKAGPTKEGFALQRKASEMVVAHFKKHGIKKGSKAEQKFFGR